MKRKSDMILGEVIGIMSKRYHYLDPRVKEEFDTFQIRDLRIPVLDCCHEMYKATLEDEAKRIEFEDNPNGCAADISYVPNDYYIPGDEPAEERERPRWGWYICDYEGAPGYERLNFCPWCGKKILYE